MPKIAFLGAGSTVFAKNLLGDCILTPETGALHIALFDIDPVRLEESRLMIQRIAKEAGRAVELISASDRLAALRDADYVINAIQVGGYEPCTVTDFEVPKKYGLRQTIGDTAGIGGIFRALRTIPVMDSFARDMEAVCPGAWLLNYTNPMSILTSYMQRYTKVKTIGLCHSVQVCAQTLLEELDMRDRAEGARWEIAGINHMAWLLSVADRQGNDLYPEIKRRTADLFAGRTSYPCETDLVRLEMMLRFGYYVTESSEHSAEYYPWFIKSRYPELIGRYNIPLDEYPRRCREQIEKWHVMRDELLDPAKPLHHAKSHEFASYIIKAMETGVSYRVHANVQNTGLIENLPRNACVEVPCLVDETGVHPCRVGELPEQCAALNRLHLGTHALTIEAARTRKKEYIYMAAMLDPHTSAELSVDDILRLVDDLIQAHGHWLPQYE